MGILRFLLAFSVFNAHAGLPIGFSIVAGSTAVHCFFVLSGFYMAMVLEEKYSLSAGSYYDFVSNRLLRLVPSYLLVVILTIAVAIAASSAGFSALPPFEAMRSFADSGAGALFHILNALSQISLLGQDFYYFLDWQPTDGLRFTPRFQEEAGGLYNLLLVPPAWSLSVEIYFYLLAPWLVRLRTPGILGLIFLSQVSRAALAWLFGFQGDPWSYRFFPSELAFFLTGVLAYRAKNHEKSSVFPWSLILIFLGTCLGLCEIAGSWQADMPVQRWARIPLFVLLVAGTPMLFSLTKDWRLDRRIGELSYPLYVSHFLVIWMIGFVFTDLSLAHVRMTLVVTAILAALALCKWVDLPVDRFRQARLRNRRDANRANTEYGNQAEERLNGTELPISAGK